MKVTWQTVSRTLDRLYFSPLKDGETVEVRSQSIDAWLEACGWSKDDVLQQLTCEILSS